VTRIAAEYFDGRTTRVHGATLSFDPDGRVRVTADGLLCDYALADVEILDRVGAHTARELRFPDGASARVPPSPAVDAFLDRAGPRHTRGWLRRLEANWRLALLAALATIAIGGVFARFGVPAVATLVAARIPPAVETRIGVESLDGMRREWLAPTRLPAARRAALEARFAAIARAHPLPGIEPALSFHASPTVGPNAFALPGGFVVVTDEIVALARDDDELEAVLAHEYGHLAARHGLQQLVQGTLVATAMALVTADMSGVVSMAAAAPAVLLQAGYSRDMEREADRFAYAWLDRRGIPRDVMAGLLTRVEAAGGAGDVPSILSTHPSLRERGEAARAR
jgi:Zn-dependent protease with chaperone function